MEYNKRSILSESKKLLANNSIPNPTDADFLMDKVMGSRTYGNEELTPAQYEEFMNLIKRRINGEPLDSLIGFTEFMGLIIPFHKETLSPRQETEIMTDTIIRSNKDRDNLKVLDLCCGSGCIGLSIAKHLNANVTLADISFEAITIASENARINNLNVDIINSDLFNNIDDKFDIIVSNPPYIPSKDIETLEREVIEYDPLLALDGGEDGLDFYKRICNDAVNHLVPKGIIYMEFGIGQALDIANMLESDYEDIEIFKDYSGIDRYIKARKK